MDFFGKETKRFSGRVDPQDSVDESIVLDYDATIEEVRVRFYPGPQLDLEVLPYRRSGRSGDRKGLVDLVGRPWIVGDNDSWSFDISEPITEGDEIGVKVRNQAATGTDQDLAYDYTVDIVVDGAGGTSRVLGTIADAIGDTVDSARRAASGVFG